MIKASMLYDIVIFGFLTLDIAAIIAFVIQFARYGMKLFTPIPTLVFLFLLISGAVIFYGSFIAPHRLTVTEQEIFLKNSDKNELEKPMRLALISDIHVGPYKNAKFVEKVVNKINTLKPDIIVIAGDSVFGDDFDITQLSPLKNLSAPMGVFGVLGNHDYEDGFNGSVRDGILDDSSGRAGKVAAGLGSLGVRVLINESAVIGGNIVIGGVDEVWTNRADVTKTFANSPTETGIMRILIAHNPDIILASDFMSAKIDLVLAGHTHGGQIRLPLWGSIPRLPTRLGRKYDQGLFDKLFITRGVGETGPRARLFATPEIALLILR
ncbi:MAG: metallophosphoesterase [Patescibacteria group bacterium]